MDVRGNGVGLKDMEAGGLIEVEESGEGKADGPSICHEGTRDAIGIEDGGSEEERERARRKCTLLSAG